jgi:hypothetical protein
MYISVSVSEKLCVRKIHVRIWMSKNGFRFLRYHVAISLVIKLYQIWISKSLSIKLLYYYLNLIWHPNIDIAINDVQLNLVDV